MSHHLDLTGLDGANPLAFLAALGTLRTVSENHAHGSVKLSWHEAGGWVPLLTTETPCTEDALIDSLFRALRADQVLEPFALGDDLRVSPSVFRAYATAAARSSTADSRRS